MAGSQKSKFCYYMRHMQSPCSPGEGRGEGGGKRCPAVLGPAHHSPTMALAASLTSALSRREREKTYARGSRTTKRAPTTRPASSRRFSAAMLPRSPSTICRLMDSPSPECRPNSSPAGRSE